MLRSLRDALRGGIRREMLEVFTPRLREECKRLKWAADWADGSDEELQAAADYIVSRYADVDARSL